MDPVSEVIGFRPSKGMPLRCETLDADNTFGIGPSILTPELPKPIEDRHRIVLCPIEVDIRARHLILPSIAILR
jgi:hypothetical protein